VQTMPSPHPLSLFDDLRVCLVYDFANYRERLPAPVPTARLAGKFPDLLADECRGGFDRDGPFHVRLPLSDLFQLRFRRNVNAIPG
jgi:hypothetical protein